MQTQIDYAGDRGDRMRWWRRLLKSGVGLVTAASLALVAQGAEAFEYFEAGPRGPVGLSRPTIGLQLRLPSGESVISAQMWLDGHKVQPVWDKSGLVRYTPTQPLEPGQHSVRLSVRVAADDGRYYYDPLIREYSFTVRPDAAAELPAPGPEALRALSEVNRYRLLAGLGPLTYSPALGAAAEQHAVYLAANPEQRVADPHRQQPGTPQFRGETLLDRAGFYSAPGATAEVINEADRAEVALAGWMDTLYHRIPLIHPDNRYFGYGLAGGAGSPINVAALGGAARTGSMALWPYPDQADVPVSWDGAERPDPLVLYPGAKRPVGYPITITFGGRVTRLALLSGSLSGPEGPVAFMGFDPQADPNLSDTVALIPESPLQPGATYWVRMAGHVDLGEGDQPFDRTWSFTTRPESRPVLKRIDSATGEAGSVYQVEGSGFAPGLKVFLGGLSVAPLSVAPDLLTFRLPAGYRGEAADLLLVSPSGEEAVWRRFLSGEQERSSDGVEAFTEVPLLVNGQPFSRPALRDGAGLVLLPEEALEAFGAVRQVVPEIGRTYWRYGSRTGDYTLGRTAAQALERRLTLALPVQAHAGATYVEEGFVRELLAGAYRAGKDGIYLGFSDIAGHWASDSIGRLLVGGVIAGTGDGRFRPDAPITRAAFVAMLVRAERLPLLPGDGGFADTVGHWVGALGYVEAAVKAGLLAPGQYPGRRFEPDRPITRQEMAAMVALALGPDAAKTVERSVAGAPFRPEQPVTRAEAALLIGRLLEE